MAAIVSGNSLGLSLTSLATLGQRGLSGTASQGRGGEQAFVNIATGNLVLQDFDDRLEGRGLDIGVVRTYNSQGLLNDDNADNWNVGAFGQRMQLSGTAGAAGSTLTRTDRDGAQAVYTWDGTRGLYVSTAGDGAFDTVAYDAGTSRFTWTDGATGLLERYESTGQGRLLSVTDPSGNTVSYAYNATGTPLSMTDANGEATYFDYSGTNLTQVRTVSSDGATLTRVRYAYDGSNRLSTVTVDLSPGDNAVADNQRYVTTYTYDGASTRVAFVTQGDGTSLHFTYVQSGGIYRVATVQDGLGLVTSYSYDTANRRTTVVDSMGQPAVYTYDVSGQLTQVKAPATGGVSQTTNFAYDANGNLIQVVDGLGRAVDMQYDANGNQVLQRDAAGNTVTRTYDTRNQLLTETAYLTPDPDGAGTGQPALSLTTRYVYDGTGRHLLRFALSPEGRVTEYRYDSYGQRTSSIAYAGGTFDTSTLSTTSVPTEMQMINWAGGQDRTLSSRTDAVYDARGQLQQTTAYARVDAAGNGIADGSQSFTQYVYDRAGQLLSTVSATAGTTQYTYDGLGRQLSAQDALGNTTLTSYDDAGRKTTVTYANGLVTTSTYDGAGRLSSVRQGSAASANLGETQYLYDANGRLYLQLDPTGARKGMLYDEAGRLVAEIDGTYRLTEYVYDAAGRITETIVYANPASKATIDALLADPASAPANLLNPVRPAASADDQRAWRIYDSAGRLVRTIDAAGAVVDTQYDGASRVTAVIEYSQKIATGSLGAAPTLAPTNPTANAANDRVTRSLYDGDGLLRGTLDAEGYLTELRYDAEGRLVQQIAYATATSAALRATGTLAQLIPAASGDDASSRWILDAQGRVAGQIDAEGYLTERVYDGDGNVTQEIRYATRVNAALLPLITAATTVADLRPSSRPEDRATTIVYDLLGRISQQTNHEGTVTQYAYDSAGHLVRTTSAVGTSESRTLNARYDVQGRLVGELTGAGSALLTGGQTQAQVDAIWAQYGLTHTYDAAGRRTSTLDAYGNRTLFFYDDDGRLTQTINALGEVAETQYNTLGQVITTTRYGTRIGAATLAGLAGGLATPALASALGGIRNSTLDSRQVFSYGTTGTVSAATDALGNTTQFTYNAFGEETRRDQAIGDGRTLVQTTTLDRRGLATGTVLDASGVNAVTSAVHDAFGRVTRTVDANGNVRQQAYDRLGRAVTTIDPLNAQRSASYDAFDRVLTQTDALGNTTVYSYDKALRSVSVTSPENITVTTVHTRQGETLRVVDGKGNTTSFSYDLNGNLVTTTTALTSTSSSYDRSDRLVQTTDANGNVVAYTYDAANRLLTRTVDPGGLNLVTTYQYDAKGQQVGVTDANGTLTQLVYDLKGQLARQVVDPSGLNLVTQYTYDGRGKTLTVVNPGGTTTRYSYDTLGRRVKEQVDPGDLDITTLYAYDKNGNLSSSTDPNGNVTRYAYDANDRLVFTLDALGNLQRTAYDAEGRVVKTVAYATPLSLAGLPAAPTLAQIEARVAASAAADSVENRVLDKDGRLAATVNGLGEVVKYAYDANGNVIERVAFANRIDMTGWTPGTAPDPVGDAAHDQRVRFVYDALDRATYTVDGTGAVVHQVFDGNGNVTERVAYATAVPITTQASAADLAAAVALVANTARDAHDRFIYDRAGRMTWHADGTGAVTRQAYDNNGNLTLSVRYANAIAATAAPDSVAANTSDRVTEMAYDRADRQTFVVDALGDVAKTYYDKNGNALTNYAFAARVAVPAATGARTEQQLEAAVHYDYDGADRVNRVAYDAANRVVMTLDASGAAVETVYDAAGNATRSIAYANLIDTHRLAGNYRAGYWDIRLLFGAGDQDRITLRAFDTGHRLAYTVDPLGYVTKNSYDAFGQLTQSTAYAHAIPSATAGTLSAIAAAVAADPGDRTDRFSYDSQGRLASSTDALGFTESHGYNALGEKTSFTNKKGAVWTYDYDAAGRLTQETSPAVDMTAVTTDTAGNLVVDAAHSGNANLVTRMAYDALGNLRSRTEALGRPEQRTTSYEYDAAGRQVKVIYPEVAIYNAAGDNLAANGATGLAGRTETLSTPYTETRYDAFGNAVSNRDVAGNYSYKAYDALGQVLYDVDAMGYVTGYQRNAWGEVTQLTRYGAATTLPAGNPASLSTAQIAAALGAAGVDHGADRVLTTEYDRLGRTTRVTEPESFIYDSTKDITIRYFNAGKTTASTYNAFGEVTRVAELTNALTQEWARTNFFYDLKGQQVAIVDALGYLTAQSFDAAGEMTAHTEFATAISGWNPENPGLAAPTTMGSADDRLTLYAYDLAGRKTGETRVQVALGAGADERANLVTGYGYDAVGNLTRTTDPTGASTYSYYDALGRVRAVAAPARPSPTGTQLTPLTEFRRDAYGNAVVTIERGRGAASASESAYTATPDATDRATYAAYDRLGHATQTTDANRDSRYSSYDARGNVAKEWQQVDNGDGVARTLFRAYQYDKLGRQTHIIDPASTTQAAGGTITTVGQAQAGLSDTAIQYNAFGEVTRRGLNGVQGEYFDYDNAGNVWRTNAGDGVDRIALYNLQGKQTAQILSYGAPGGNGDLRGVANAEAAAWIDEARTDMVYDALGHLVQTTGVAHQESTGGVRTGRTYTSATINSRAQPSGNEPSHSANTQWVGSNSVTVSWAALSALGSGDVKVVLEYLTGEPPSDTPPQSGDESSNPAVDTYQERRTYTQVVSNMAQGANSTTLTWTDPVGATGGISRITGLTIYKKDVSGNWQQISDQDAVGFGSQVIDIDTPADPATTPLLELRAAGSPGDTGWFQVGLVNFGDSLRFDASGLPPGNYEYRATMTDAAGNKSTTGYGALSLAAPPLAVIGTPPSFANIPGIWLQGRLKWPSPPAGVDQVFRMRLVGSSGAWQSLLITPQTTGWDGVDVSAIPAGTYDYELQWIHSGDGVPYAHATGQISSTGAQPAHDVPQQNYPPLPLVSSALVTLPGSAGDTEAGIPAQPPTPNVPVMQWDLQAVYAGVTTFRYRLQGSGEWSSLEPFTQLAGDESNVQNGVQRVDLRGLPPGDYEYQILSTWNLSTGPMIMAQATGHLIISATPPGQTVLVPTLVDVPVDVTPADPAGFITGWTGSGPSYGPPVVLGYNPDGTPMFGPGYGRDIIGGNESSGYVYGPVRAIPYYTYHTETVTQSVPVQVAVGQDPVYERDESGNILTTPVFETRTGTRTVGVPVQVGTDPVYATDEAGNIRYETIYETQTQTQTVPVYGWVQVPRTEAYLVMVQGPPIMYQDESGQWYPARDDYGNILYQNTWETHYRTVYDPVYTQTGWTTQTVQVQVPVQRPILIGYVPRYETQYHQETYTYQVQVGSQPVQARDESGNLLFETRYETQYQDQTVEVQVPTLVTPPDPAQYIISAHSGEPIYGPPVVVGVGESNQPIYGRGYSMVNGVVVATPYVDIQKQWKPVETWVPGTPAAPTMIDTTPPYVPAQHIPAQPAVFASSSNTQPGGSAISDSGTAATPAGQSPWIDGSELYPRPVVNQNVDRWGNVLAIGDPRSANWVTTYRYNADNQIIEQRQPDASGGASANSPVTQISYDLLGRQVAVKDANDHVQRKTYDAGGNLASEIDALGNTIRHVYDAFGERVGTTDALGNATSFTYDNVGRLLTTRHAAVNVAAVNAANNRAEIVANTQLVETSTWNSAGRKLSQTNGDGETIRYVYDLAGNVVRTIQPLGQSTVSAYDAHGNKVAELDANGALATWSYNYFGRLLSHTDLGGRAYAYSYDNAGHLVYDSGTNRHYEYTLDGFLSRTFDATTGQDERYEYDRAGNRVREWFSQGGVVYKDNHIAYDALGRMRWVSDGRAYVNIEYDKVGNRTHINTHVLTQDTSQDSNLYYQYDAMNRQTVVDAVNAQGDIGQQGHLITYDANGNRRSDTWWGNVVTTVAGQPRPEIVGYDGTNESAIYVDQPTTYAATQGYTSEQYDYDAMGRMTNVVRDGVQTDARLYDGASRVVQTGTSSLPVGYINALNGADLHGQALAGTGSELRVTRYDDNGRVARQDVYRSDGQQKYVSIYDAIPGGGAPGVAGTGGYDAVGNLLGYTVFDYTPLAQGQGVNVTNYANTFQAAEGYQQKTSSGTSNKSNPGQTTWDYGNAGELKTLTDATMATNNRSFVSDTSGTIVYAEQAGQGQYQLVVNGEVLGRYGQIRDEDNPTVMASPGLGQPPRLTPNFKTGAEFNFGYAPVDGNYPSASPGTYAVSAGDTLQAIARGAYGDESLWYLIADANGLGSNADLNPGQVLTIPSRVSSANNANSFRPYDPTRVVGDTTPNMPMPAGDDNEACGGFGTVIIAVIAVAVAVISQNYYLANYGTAALAGTDGAVTMSGLGTAEMVAQGTAVWTTGSAVTAGAIAGATGSIVSQIAGNALGIQDGFSWKGVALSAIGGGVSAGLGGFAPTGNVVGDAVIRTAVANSLTQGIAVATGLQSSFNWRSVAASAVGAGVGSAVGGALGNSNAFADLSAAGRGFAIGAVSGFAGGLTTAAMRGGRISATQVATDAFGVAIGSSLAAANTSIPGPVSVAERQTIMGYFVDGPGTGATPSVALIDGSTISSAENFRRVQLSYSQQAMASNDILSPSAQVVMSDAGTGSAPRLYGGVNRDGTITFDSPSSDVSSAGDGGLSDAAIASMRRENLARMQESAAQSATATYDSNGQMASYQDASGQWHVVVSGVGQMPEAAQRTNVYSGSGGTAPSGNPYGFDWSWLGGAGLGIGLPDFHQATPVPAKPVLPVNNGRWTGVPGNSGWVSANPSVTAITGGRPVQFKNEMVNFDPWSQGRFNIPGMTGSDSDLRLGRDALREKYGLPTDPAAKQWLRDRGLTLHHNANGLSLDLIPSDLHNTRSGGIPHSGGASILRNWNAPGTPLQFYRANQIATGARYLGVAGMAYGAYADGTSLYNQYQISQQTGSYANTAAEATRIAGGWAGAWAAGTAGAELGAVAGTTFGPVGTVVGGVIGGVAGGALGYVGGSYALPRVAYDLGWLNKPAP